MADLRKAESWKYAKDENGVETKYAVVCGDWTITKWIVGGEKRFGVWRGKTPDGNIFATAQEARDRAYEMAQEVTA